MTQQTLIPEFRYSERGLLRAGDTFRARGGATYKGSRVGEPGLYRMIGIHRCRQRVYLEAVRVDRHGLQVSGVSLLYVSGKPYRLDGLENWIVRPYHVSRCR